MTIEQLIEEWKKKLLDLSKRNNLLNFRTTRRGNLEIVYPDFEELYSSLTNGDDLQFAKPSQAEEFDLFGEEEGGNQEFSIKSNAATLKEESAALRGLRRRAKTIMEEQGINVLYVAFGLVRWKEMEDTTQEFTSPLVLVPVTLSIKSVVDPYILSFNDDEITVNPTLRYKLEHDFNLILPDFDDSQGIDAYLSACERLFNEHPDWSIERSAFLSIFSYLKINMYYDLSRNVETADANAIIQAFSGDFSGLAENVDIMNSIGDINYDKDINPKDVFQVLDADTSQQGAIELAKRGASFVLQGPPGTGKSQTITNIIAESLAAGKTVLFVSEKEAALNVVKHRLEQTNLLDFCLPMHSHKANKKEIISELYRTAELGRERVKEGALIQLERLYGERLKLDQLSEELHRQIPPLNLSVFEVNGEIASMETTPHFLFSVDDINDYSQRKLSDIQEKIELLTANIQHFNGDRFSSLWNECSLPILTNEKRYEFRAIITSQLSDEIQEVINTLNSTLLGDCSASWIELPQYVALLSHCSKGENMPISWLTTTQEELEAVCDKWLKAFETIQGDRETVEKTYNSDVVGFNSAVLLVKADKLKKVVENDTTYSIDNYSSPTYLGQLMELNSEGESIGTWVNEFSDYLKTLFPQGLDIPNLKLNELKALTSLIISLADAPGINSEWCSPKGVEEVSCLISDIEAKRQQEKSIREDLLAGFDKEIFFIDAKSLLPKFRADYSSFLRAFNSEYKRDLNKLRGLSKNAKVSYKDALGVLSRLKDLAEIKSWYTDNSKIIDRFFGPNTDPDTLDLTVASTLSQEAKEVVEYFRGAVPEPVKARIASGAFITREAKSVGGLLSASLNSSVYTQSIPNLLKGGLSCSLQNASRMAQRIKECSGAVMIDMEELGSYAEQPLLSLETLDPLIRWQTFLGDFDGEASDLSRLFETEMNGVDTDWNSISKKLAWLKEFKNLISSLIPWHREFCRQVMSSPDTRLKCEAAGNTIESIVSRHNQAISKFDKWFQEDHSIVSIPLVKMKAIVDYYRENIDYLESWLAYRKVYRELRDMGLGDFLLRVVDNQDVDPAEYIGVFNKRFYTIWLDYAKGMLPCVSSMSKIELDTLLNDFQSHDTKQFTIAQARIREILSEKLPNVNVVASANDQLGILKREYNKQRRQLPIRKLFNSIPELVLRLKPCLMMSPLSVSLFLENPGYVFDVVIFDEASQVKPENAIGSIIRGKQVIVTGDSHQLPPTNFFQTNLSEEDLYDDDEEEDLAMEESVLDACARVLPERYLKWHYRSRDEHLIAFSNTKIYDSRLTTFPSSIEKEKDMGVEFVYVPNGVYERGGRKNNPKEAEKVADLVFEHFKNHPKRSLGVIANSDCQARTIEDIVNRRRAQRPIYERYFSEERDEPFFVKSLESVQGDERDTIIFSIGYGKDANGRMVQNFGPINKDGGERRLNVAVTRAKYNFKLVSSIGADAIEVTESTKAGPKTLKAYIDYAQRGMPALTGDLEEGHELQFDSPFEESVYNFLTEKGYSVTTQVGCAGYRIDLGVKDPENPGRYVLAVECDGAAYHSSSYARERDRLRQQVLENMGWHFHRIWSTEWIHSTSVAKDSLLRAIEIAISSAPQNGQLFDKTDDDVTVDSLIDKVEKAEEETNIQTVLDFAEYKTADRGMLAYSSVNGKLMKLLEIECPLHYNYIARKLAPYMGFSRASTRVRLQLDCYLADYYNKIERKGDFIYLKPMSSEYKMRINSGRDITEICPEELEYAMLAVAKRMIGATEELLIDETAHNIGFAHSKSKIKGVLKEIFDSLTNKGLISVLPSGSISVK